jgi:predicted deacylase
VEQLHEGVLRVLVHLNMLDDGPDPAPDPAVLTSFDWLYSPAAGMFYPTVRVGDDVLADAIVGTIGTFTGERIAEIRSPVAGKVLFLTTSPAMKDGGLLMGIGVA